MIPAQWDRRIRRATELSSTYSFAAEGLRFYARVATFQKSLYAEIQKALMDSPKISADRPLRDELDLFLLLPRFSLFLSVIQQIAPAPLAQAADELGAEGPSGMATGDRRFLAWGSGIVRGRGHLWPCAGLAIRTMQIFPIDCWHGFFFNPMPSILRITARSRS